MSELTVARLKEISKILKKNNPPSKLVFKFPLTEDSKRRRDEDWKILDIINKVGL